MKKYLLLLVLPLIVMLSSCHKALLSDIHPPPPPDLDTLADYVPTTTGSWWKYGISSSNDASYTYTDSITMTMTGDSLHKYGKAFSIATANNPEFNGTDKFYFYKNSAQYKTYTTIVNDYRTGTDFDVPILLDGKMAIRDTSYYIPDSDPAKPAEWLIISNVDNQNYMDFTIKGKTYHNCIGTGVYINKLYEGTDPRYVGGYTLYSVYTFVFAPNIGIIQEVTDSQIISLTSYSVKPKL